MWSLHPLDADFHVWHLESWKSFMLLSNTIHSSHHFYYFAAEASGVQIQSHEMYTYKCTQRSNILSEKCTVLRSWPNDLWNSKESVPRPSTSCCAPFNVWEIWYFVESDAPHVCILRLNVRMCRQSDYKIYVSNRGGPLAILISKGSTKQGFLTTVLL